MIRTTIVFLRGEVAASNQAQKKALPAWKQQEPGRKQNFDRKEDFQNQQSSERRHDKFNLLIKSPREIMALDKGPYPAPLESILALQSTFIIGCSLLTLGLDF
ncbi:hypothetical protein Tco_0898557 [Tanacetum coccineum]